MTNDDGRKPEGAPARSPKAGASFRATEAWFICLAVALLARRCRSEISPSILGRSVRLRTECVAGSCWNSMARSLNGRIPYRPSSVRRSFSLSAIRRLRPEASQDTTERNPPSGSNLRLDPS